jgi:hypothetical protein
MLMLEWTQAKSADARESCFSFRSEYMWQNLFGVRSFSLVLLRGVNPTKYPFQRFLKSFRALMSQKFS